MSVTASKAAVLAVAAILLTGAAAADVSEDDLHINQVAATDQANGGTGFTLNQLFSTVSGDTLTIQSGDENVFYSFDIDLTDAVDNGRLVVELNRCDDGVDYNRLTRSDCNDNVFSTVVKEDVSGVTGDTVHGWASIDFPQASGNYEVVGYVANDRWRLVSDAPHLFVTAESSTDDGSGGDGSDDGSDDADDAAADVVATRAPTVDVSGDTVTGIVTFENQGGADMPSSHIVEMQVRPKGAGPLSFAGTQRVCDADHPENVHKEFHIDSGDQLDITLSAPAPDTDKAYDVYFLTRDSCAATGSGNERVDPYGNSVQVRDVCVGTCTTDTTGGGVVGVMLGVAGVVAAAVGGWFVLG